MYTCFNVCNLCRFWLLLLGSHYFFLPIFFMTIFFAVFLTAFFIGLPVFLASALAIAIPFAVYANSFIPTFGITSSSQSS